MVLYKYRNKYLYWIKIAQNLNDSISNFLFNNNILFQHLFSTIFSSSLTLTLTLSLYSYIYLSNTALNTQNIFNPVCCPAPVLVLSSVYLYDQKKTRAVFWK